MRKGKRKEKRRGGRMDREVSVNTEESKSKGGKECRVGMIHERKRECS